jgi:phospholipase/carboxylesterase
MSVEIANLLAPLLQSLTVLEFIARHLDPLEIEATIASIGTPDENLRAVRQQAEAQPRILEGRARQLLIASDEALAAFDGIRQALQQGDDLYALFRALRHLPRAQEALYPLAAELAAVNSYFLDSSLRKNAGMLARSAQPVRDGETGVMSFEDEPGSRGGYLLYVPESYTPERALPLVMALHGGSGNGRSFLWSWLRDARSFGAILVAPTAIGRTWALMGDDVDTPNLNRILDHVGDHWRIDSRRLLLTGMSDGGTFCYVSGLEAGSRFTHLAPACATFHPLMATMADAERMRGLPIYMVHGARDWMFPVEVARNARLALANAGANVSYREIEDLSQCYPREVNKELLAWMAAEPNDRR